MSDRRIIDPDFFDEAIGEFRFQYNWFIENSKKVDDLGRLVSSFDKQTIYGSLQPDASTLNQSVDGNYQSLKYRFYCKAIYRINIGDFLQDDDGNYLHVDGVQNYDGWGVRQCTLTMVTLNQYKNFQDYIKYLNGEKIL